MLVTEMKAELLQLKRISEDDAYNAFTTLTHDGEFYWLAFRQGKAHVSPHGKIIVYRSKDAENWDKYQVIEKEGLDLRDPRLKILNGELILIAFSLKFKTPEDDTKKDFDRYSTFFYKLDASNKFTEFGKIPYDKYESIFWTVEFYDNYYYGAGYRVSFKHHTAALWKTKDLSSEAWKKVFDIPEFNAPANMGYNEVDIVISEFGETKGEMLLFCRLDSESTRGLKFRDKLKFHKEVMKRKKKSMVKLARPIGKWFSIAQSYPPYDEVSIHSIPIYIRGPRAIEWGKDSYILVGRYRNSFKELKKVEVFHFTKRSENFVKRIVSNKVPGDKERHLMQRDDSLESLLTLCQGDDGSYAGLLRSPKDENILLISFYSDHERIKTKKRGKVNDIWLAKVRINLTE